MKTWIVAAVALFAAGTMAQAASGHDHGAATKHENSAPASATVTVTGEILDMACYLDHGAQGEKHAACAKTCIESGLPVGIKGNDGKTYLVIGEHKPINKLLAAHAGKVITVRGKIVQRDGFNLLANAEIVSTTGK